MRPDMHEVIIERPRWAHAARYPRASVRNRHGDDPPSREAMGRGYREKHLSDNLAPLVRFLRSRVGRPWDRVHSEISERLRVTSAIQKHVLDHLRDFVEVTPRGPRSRRNVFYVDAMGLLRERPTRPRKLAGRIRLERRSGHVRVLGPRQELRLIDGSWYCVDLAEIPPYGSNERAIDAITRTAPSRYGHRAPPGIELLWLRGLYVARARALTKRERIRLLS